MSNEFDPSVHEAEVKERWGDTDAYRESSRRTKQYTPEQVAEIKAELESVEARLAEVMLSGAKAESEAAMDAAEAARLHIHRWYYPCSHAMHVNLGAMYTSDARFKAHYDDRAEGLAQFVQDAITANAGRASV